jgi:hypothetical protein
MDSRLLPALELSSQPPGLTYPRQLPLLDSPVVDITPINLGTSTSHPAVELPVTEGRVARLPLIDRAVAAERYNIDSGLDLPEVLPR